MQRMLLAIISSIAVQFVFISCLILITNLNTDYTSWIQDTWTTVTSFRMWSYFLVLATVTFLQGVTCSKMYLSTPPYFKSRFAKFCGILTSQNILLACMYITIGGVLVWLHLSLKGSWLSSLTTNCSTTYGNCLVEEHYFLLLSGLWSGLYFFTKTKVFQVKYLKFPIIPLSKFFRLKRGIYSMLPSVMMASVWPTFYYINAYYFLGSYFRSVILFLTTAQLENEPLDSISRIFSFPLMFHLWLYQLIIMLTINSMYLLFEVFLTDWVPFEIGQNNVFGDATGLTLVESLSMEKIPIMQHLGYLDLVTVAQKDKLRRNILFTLSQPGGHPYNWNCTVEKVIGLIKNFSDELSTASVKVQEQVPVAPNSTTASTFQKEYVYHMRSLVTQEVPTTTAETDVKQPSENEQFIYKFIKTKWQNFVAYLLSKRIIHYVFGEQDGGKVCYFLFSGQSIIWAADAISSLAVSSLTEDAYGIVQKDLPLIITTLLSLKQSLDKLQKSNILAKKQFGDDDFIRQIFNALRAATKRSLYRIVTHFDTYITGIPLEPIATEQLHHFLSYRE